MRTNLLAGFRQKLGVRSGEHPSRSVADVNLISGGPRLQNQRFVRGRFEIIRYRLRSLGATAKIQNKERRATQSHTNKFVTLPHTLGIAGKGDASSGTLPIGTHTGSYAA